MKILFLVQKEQRVILDRLYDGVSKNVVTDIRWLSSAEQDNLKTYFKNNIKLIIPFLFFLCYLINLSSVPKDPYVLNYTEHHYFDLTINNKPLQFYFP